MPAFLNDEQQKKPGGGSNLGGGGSTLGTGLNHATADDDPKALNFYRDVFGGAYSPAQRTIAARDANAQLGTGGDGGGGGDNLGTGGRDEALQAIRRFVFGDGLGTNKLGRPEARQQLLTLVQGRHPMRRELLSPFIQDIREHREAGLGSAVHFLLNLLGFGPGIPGNKL